MRSYHPATMEVQLQKPELVRRHHFAGTSYASDPLVLGTEIDKRVFDTTRPVSVKGEIGAIVTSTMAQTLYKADDLGSLRALNRKKYSTVVAVASAQMAFFDYASVYLGGAYDTPLGRVFVDLPAAEKMAHSHPKVVFSDTGHTGGKEAEYSIEMVLPFLQKLIGDFRFVPVVMGSDDEGVVAGVGEALAASVNPENTLIVGCSELRFDSSVSADKVRSIAEAAEKFDWRMMYDRLRNTEVAGTAPLAAIIYAAKRLRIKRVEALVSKTSDGTDLSLVVLH